jgi:hypothetical protein
MGISLTLSRLTRMGGLAQSAEVQVQSPASLTHTHTHTHRYGIAGRRMRACNRFTIDAGSLIQLKASGGIGCVQQARDLLDEGRTVT